MDRRVDTLMALCVALFGIFVFVSAQVIRPSSVYDPIGSKGGPELVGIVLLVGGLVLMLRRVLRWRNEETLVPSEGTDDDAGVAPGSSIRAMSIWAAAMAYVLAMPILGYLIVTPVFVAAGLYLLEMRRPLVLVAVPIAFTIPVFLAFSQFLNVRLPTGVLDGVLRQMGLV